VGRLVWGGRMVSWVEVGAGRVYGGRVGVSNEGGPWRRAERGRRTGCGADLFFAAPVRILMPPVSSCTRTR